MQAIPSTALAPTLHAADRRRLGNYHLQLLSVADLDAVMDVREEVLSHLEHPDLYVREDDEAAFLRRHLGGDAHCRGETIGVYDGERLVAYAMLGLPAATDAVHLGRHIPLGNRLLDQVAHLASCMVRPGHRGHGLQRTLLAARFSLAHVQGRPLCVAMVSLHNHASRRNLMRAGLRIVHVGDVMALKRQLVAIDLGRAWDYHPGQARLVDSGDFDAQCELTHAGWWGVSTMEGSGPDVLVFARAMQAQSAPR